MQLELGDRDPVRVEAAERLGRRGGVGQGEPDLTVGGVDVWLLVRAQARERGGGVGDIGGVGDANAEHRTADGRLELRRSSLGGDPAVVDDGDPLGEPIGLVEVLGGEQDGGALATKLVDRLRVRGERADRFRVRPGAWDDQIRDPGSDAARALLAQGLEALADAPPSRRARLVEMDALYAWYQARMPALLEEWREYKRTRLGDTNED